MPCAADCCQTALKNPFAIRAELQFARAKAQAHDPERVVVNHSKHGKKICPLASFVSAADDEIQFVRLCDRARPTAHPAGLRFLIRP